MAKNDYFGGVKSSSGLGGRSSNTSRSYGGGDVVSITNEIDTLAEQVARAKNGMVEQLALYAREAISGNISVPNQKTAISHLDSLVKRMQLPAEVVNEILIAALAKVIMNG